MSLLDKLKKVGAADVKGEIITNSSFFNSRQICKTDLPILNVAFTGDIDGGMPTGLTIVAGASKTFKSAISLYCMKAYLEEHKDGVAIFYDTEGGITPDYLKSFKIDTDRVLHIPVDHIEQLKFDMMKKLDEIKKGDKVFFLVDSIGQISSKKEVEDATDEKSVADMTRAKALRSLLRLCTMQFMKKELPCIMINHVYANIGGTGHSVTVGGGSSVVYSANTVWIIGKSQEKDGTELTGWNFNINIEKSRYIREKSRLSIQVLYDSGIQKYSGMLDLALESGHIAKPSMGWYQLVDADTGEMVGGKVRAANADPLIEEVIKREKFKQWVKDKFKPHGAINDQEDTIEEIEDAYLTESDD